MIRLHRTAVVSLLTGLTVVETHAQGSVAAPYVALHTNQGTASSTSYDAIDDFRGWEFTTVSAGTDTDQAQLVAEKVEARLLGTVPTVPGRVCGPITKQVSRAVIKDTTVPIPVFIARDVWAFSSVPA